MVRDASKYGVLTFCLVSGRRLTNITIRSTNRELKLRGPINRIRGSREDEIASGRLGRRVVLKSRTQVTRVNGLCKVHKQAVKGVEGIFDLDHADFVSG